MNVQYAIQRDTVFCFGSNPRASRTVPFVSKRQEYRWRRSRRGDDREELATLVSDCPAQRYGEIAVHEFYSVKSPVFPFNKFRGVDTHSRSRDALTGEVMGISTSYGQAFAEGALAAGSACTEGTVFSA